MLVDGTIESWTGAKNKLTLKVNCEYLAELIDEAFDSFILEIIAIDKIEHYPWLDPTIEDPNILTELEDIFKAELEISSAAKIDNYVIITCNQHDATFNYSGGNLSLNCNEIKIFDQKNNLLTIDFITEICRKYWDNFEKRKANNVRI